MGKGKSACDGKTSKKEERTLKQQYRKQRQKQKIYSATEEVQFNNLLKTMGLFVRNVSSDGNCMFRSISDQLEGNEECHNKYRQQILDYIDHNKEHFSFFIEDDETIDQYISRLRSDGEWGDQPELYAASQKFQIDIYVHQVDAPRFVILCETISTRSIHVSYHGGCHYNSVRRLDDDSYTPARVIHIDDTSATTNSSSSKQDELYQQVKISTPWASREDILIALEMTENNIDETIEILISNPDGLSPHPSSIMDNNKSSNILTVENTPTSSNEKGTINNDTSGGTSSINSNQNINSNDNHDKNNVEITNKTIEKKPSTSKIKKKSTLNITNIPKIEKVKPMSKKDQRKLLKKQATTTLSDTDTSTPKMKDKDAINTSSNINTCPNGVVQIIL